MIMNNCMLPDILQRLREVNTLLATYKQGELSFEQALPPSLFYQDFNDTNILVKEAACLVRENPGELLEFSSSLFSETDKYLSLDRTPLQKVDFAALFEEHLKPFEFRYEETKTVATGLWRKYSAMSNRLDSYRWIRKNTSHSTRNAARQRRSMTKSTRTRTYYMKNGSRSVTGISVSGASNRYSSTYW